MSRFTCPFCGYKTDQSSNFIKHLSLKKLCEPVIADVSIDEIKHEMMSKKVNNEFECLVCHKMYASIRTLRYHITDQHRDIKKKKKSPKPQSNN